MAAERIFDVNSLLCFAIHSSKKLPLQLVKSVIGDYYDNEAITIAKNSVALLMDYRYRRGIGLSKDVVTTKPSRK